MKVDRRLFVAVGMVLAGCSSYTLLGKIDAPSRPMSVRAARELMARAVPDLTQNHGKDPIPVAQVRSNRQRVVLGITRNGKSGDYYIEYATIQSIAVEAFYHASTGHTAYRVLAGPNMMRMALMGDKSEWQSVCFETESAARRFVDGLLTLKNAASVPDNEESDFATFSAAATTWLAADPKPPMSDDARASKAMAEDEFKRKEFGSALDAYLEALGKHPMWPEGHYNAALLAGEIEDYEVAAKHMRRYLALAPDAKDASAAKDKYLLWQRKAKQ
jgi:tetratricopeptide (TPR) repeat protein